MIDLRYPIGQFDFKEELSKDKLEGWIEDIEKIPFQLEATVNGLSAEQLDTTYRPGGWTIRQVVHHIADSHLNSYVRFKIALTEDQPTIKPYLEDQWAQLPDYDLPVGVSLQLLKSVHERWTTLLRSMTISDFERKYNHPETGQTTLGLSLGLYAWHGYHHHAHITTLKESLEW
ncbi:putative metal-dependent hydrolase [Aquibacillus halophilus]|uniref:Putative metal-dependent hydrolase GH741_07580 n=1 Tax=Aquibacillus halophilus TaxID=930132 RepID=A0A6A8DMR5_9BACI|nr:putative metal-dependent hydrolase [Aquibacillus halophilus]MRH42542.1 putative metal-dependent hydrolase [Aquibacillus halophilus]